jgi:HPt (histidine-containing phosphotransfer) domain-containing protein
MVDWERVAELRSHIGAEDFTVVVDLFLEETDEAIARLGAVSRTAEVEAVLHFLKGSALNLGLAALAQICADGERRAAAGQADAVDLGEIAASYARSRSALVEGLATRTAA